jgi:hypothetical protein
LTGRCPGVHPPAGLAVFWTAIVGLAGIVAAFFAPPWAQRRIQRRKEERQFRVARRLVSEELELMSRYVLILAYFVLYDVEKSDPGKLADLHERLDEVFGRTESRSALRTASRAQLDAADRAFHEVNPITPELLEPVAWTEYKATLAANLRERDWRDVAEAYRKIDATRILLPPALTLGGPSREDVSGLVKRSQELEELHRRLDAVERVID